MTTGTKIVLAVIGLVVGIMIAYYGFLMPGGSADAPVVRDPVASRPPATPAGGDAAPLAADRPKPSAGLAAVTMGQPPALEAAEADAREMGPVLDPSRLSREDPDATASPPLVPRPGRAWTPLPASALSDGGKSTPLEVSERGSLSEPASATPGAPDVSPSTLRANQPARVTSPPAPRYTLYTVRGGDTMSSIARTWLGDPNKWDLVAKANPLVDPARLRIGQVLRLPAKDAEREPVAVHAGATTHVVRSGDTLSSIAEAHYGRSSYWREIHDANRKLIGSDPDDLTVGMRLVIPALSR